MNALVDASSEGSAGLMSAIAPRLQLQLVIDTRWPGRKAKGLSTFCEFGPNIFAFARFLGHQRVVRAQGESIFIQSENDYLP